MKEATEVERLNKVITAKNEKIADLEMELRKVLSRVGVINELGNKMNETLEEIQRNYNF